LGLASLLIILPRSPLPWFDEIFMESTALSIVRGHGPVPTVLGAFSGIKSLSLFFGPVALAVGAADVRLFGISIIAWRSIGWLGVVAVALLASWLTRNLAGAYAGAVTAILVAFSQGTGRAVSGRLDSLAVALEVASLACAVAGLPCESSSRNRARLYTMLSGVFCGLAILSTPRAFPFPVSLFLAFGAEALCNKEQRKKILSQMLQVAAVIGALILAWTTFEGTNPLGWLRFILSVSHGDPGNVSPLLGGHWHLFDSPLLEQANGLGFLLVLLMLLISATAARRTANATDSATPGLRFALVAGLACYGVTFVLISRFWDYDIFLVPLLLPAAIALTGNIWRRPGRRSYRFVALIGAWVLWATVCLFVRGGKLLVSAASYQSSDPSPMEKFVAQHVPPGSIVFGPLHDYFYAVENAGSRFLYPRPWIAPGFSREVANERPPWGEMLRANRVYVIWPAGSRVPEELTPNCLELVGRFEPQENHGRWSRRWSAIGQDRGYPPTLIFRVIRAPQ